MWRIERSETYCIGCVDHYSDGIKGNGSEYLKEFVGKKLLKSSVINPFQDAKFEFEDGFVIKTFSCFKEREQWAILNKNKESIYSANIALANV